MDNLEIKFRTADKVEVLLQMGGRHGSFIFFVIAQDKKVLSKSHLQEAMGKLEPPIKFRLADRTEALIQKVVESMRGR